jgi:hypothetical protein
MPRSAQSGFEDSLAYALGALYERKARGATLIRVLEDYRRFKQTPSLRFGPVVRPIMPELELERLRMRRAAVDQLIRSIEAYSGAEASAQAHQ